jgi:hypothetical protein
LALIACTSRLCLTYRRRSVLLTDGPIMLSCCG